jgi:HSP20 family protein
MWTRVNDLDRMFDVMDQLRSKLNKVYTNYGGTYGQDYGWRVGNGSPQTNLYDTGDAFEVIAEVPGFSKEDLNIRIQGNYLELSGCRKADMPKEFKAHRVERNATSFTRSFTLPADVDAEKTQATLKDGMLTLVLTKAQAAKPLQITIS